MRSVLRVGFDGRDLLRKRTGVVNNAVNLARQLGARHGPEFIVYADTYRDERAPDDMHITRLKAPPVVWKHVALPLALARDRVSVFHSPTGTLPLLAPCRQVVTIHDLFASIEPRWFAPGMAKQLQTMQRMATRKAHQVIAVSERTKADLVERYGVRPERVTVVYNGVDHARFRPPDSSTPPMRRRGPTAGEDEAGSEDAGTRNAGAEGFDAEKVAARFGVSYPFVLCVGSLLPWRNAPRLLRAVARLDRFGLLFVGRDIWGTDPTARLATEQRWAWARFAGYVADDELPSVYAAASVFAYPSLYEGFGIPPLEAMACGTPVVASTAGALPEVLGDAALLVDPYDELALAEAIQAAADDRGELRRRGLQRARRFTWDTTAEATWRVYEESAR